MATFFRRQTNGSAFAGVEGVCLGRKSLSALENASLSFLSAIDTDGGLDAVLFLRRTGSVLASWTREGIRLDVVSVMAATMLASIDTIVEALGGPSSRSIAVTSGDRQIIATKLGSQAFLFVVAPRSVSQRHVRKAVRELVDRLTAASAIAPPRTDAGPSKVEAKH
jgi:predicted regulator of Ras-like GTPase activity (Roadblock/LC7/MglB family)